MRAHLIITGTGDGEPDQHAWTGEIDQLPGLGTYIAPPGTRALNRVVSVEVFLAPTHFANIRAVPDDRIG